MKGIILAGGSGTRLYPITQAVCKQLLPVYDKPMVYYPLSILIMADIRDILIISTPSDLPRFRTLLGDGQQWGLNITYKLQEVPNGLAQAFILGQEFIGNSNVALILGDNIFFGTGLQERLQECSSPTGATIFGYRVSNPQDYGVVEFNEEKKVLSLEEKPRHPRSNYAVPGLYFYDNSVVDFARSLRPSARGEYEITDLNSCYLREQRLTVKILGRGTAWFDTGSFDSLLAASSFVQAVEKRQGLKIGCPEELAFRKGFITENELEQLAQPLMPSGYGKYLMGLLDSTDLKNLR